MKKIGLGILIALVTGVFTVGVALALPEVPGIEKAKEKSPAIDEVTRDVVAPPPSVTPFPQLSESELTKIVFIRYAPGKEPVCDNDGICEPRENWKNCSNDCAKGGEEEPPPETTCYGFLAGSKPKWNWVEDFVYSDENLAAPSFNAVITWEAPVSGDIFGAGSYDTGYDWGVYDYTNSVNYGDYDDTGMCPTAEPCVIGVTAIWFRAKNIYEYDIMFDTDFFPGNFDLPTVTLHEFGHAAGLDDLYDVACVDNAMYGYLSEGEVKTTLSSGDVTGIQTLYGGF